MRLAVGGFRLLVPDARRGGGGRPFIGRGRCREARGRFRHGAIAVTGAHPVKRMQPRIEHPEADHEDNRVSADDAGPRPGAKHPLPNRPGDRELDKVDQGENRP